MFETTPEPLRADARANREAVLAAAARLYAQRGLEVSYEDLAQEAGVGRATIYRHFPTRDALLAAILDQMLAEIEAIAAALPPGPDRFLVLFDANVALQERNLPLVDLVTQAGLPDDRLQRARRRFEAIFSGPLAEAQQAGLVRAEIQPSDVRVMSLMLSSLARTGVRPGDRARAAQLSRLILSGSAPAS